jgi:hypothetical protein
MADGDLILFSEQQRRLLERMFASFGRSLGGGDVSVVVGPDGQLSVSRVPRSRSGVVAREQFALVRLTAADATDPWKYVGEEVIGNDPDADPPTWAVKTPGRTWGVESEDEGLIVHPQQVEGLEVSASGVDAVFMVRRVVVDGGGPRWVIVGQSKPGPIAVKLLQTGGSAGDATTQCSFTYTVQDMNGNELATGVDPTDSPHLAVRPSVGFRVAARSGLASFETGELVVLMTNEETELEACS